MNWRGLIGTELTVDGEKMIVTDYCRGCRKIWAESKNERFYLGLRRSSDEIYISNRKIKQLE
jgi:hypothetical protein